MTFEHLHRFRDMLIDAMQREITILTYTFSWWDIFVFDIVVSIIVYIIVTFVFDEL